MKHIFTPFFSLLILTILGAATCEDDKKTKDCIDTSKINLEAICTMQYDPVCGCDGVTYSNDCQAQAAGVLRWKSGSCDKE